ncbi:MAG: two-component sensor histidine kinase [Betaproteobacteria bacterium]|nr:two-component sensor histidine kinase [Betaproteobacteria bacterium]
MSEAAEPPPQRIERLERELRLARNELDEFTRAVSHDLRAPLRHLGAYTQILREDLPEPQLAQALPHLDRISEAARLMGQQIDGLMRLAQCGQAPIQPEPVDVGALAQAVYTDLRRQSGPDADEGPDARAIAWQVAPDIPPLLADAALMREALAQLLANALKFTRPRAQARISLTGHQELGQCVLNLADNGVGFNPAYHARLFQPFSRLHSAKAFEGLGLGLAISRKIIERHGGEIEASREPDGGCRVSVRLPLA